MYQTVHVREEPLRTLNAEVPPALEAVVARALAKSQEDRYTSMREFARALREVGRTLPAPQPSLPIVPPTARAPTIPPPGEPSPETADAAAPASTAEGHVISPAFDSLEGTMRLAALTDAPIDITRILRPPAAPVPEPEIEAPAEGSKSWIPPPAVPGAGETGAMPAQTFPLVPAAILGALAFVALVLGIALAV
jgi:serine/threonine-protein kinase